MEGGPPGKRGLRSLGSWSVRQSTWISRIHVDFNVESTWILRIHDTIHGYFNIIHVDSNNKQSNPRGFWKIHVDLANNPRGFNGVDDLSTWIWVYQCQLSLEIPVDFGQNPRGFYKIHVDSVKKKPNPNPRWLCEIHVDFSGILWNPRGFHWNFDSSRKFWKIKSLKSFVLIS